MVGHWVACSGFYWESCAFQDLSLAVNGQPQGPPSVAKGQTKPAEIGVHTGLAHTGHLAGAHARLQACRVEAEGISDQCCIHFETIQRDGYGCHGSNRIPVFFAVPDRFEGR